MKAWSLPGWDSRQLMISLYNSSQSPTLQKDVDSAWQVQGDRTCLQQLH